MTESSEADGSKRLFHDFEGDPVQIFPDTLSPVPTEGDDVREPVSRTPSRLLRVQTQLLFFSERWKNERLLIAWEFLKIYVVMGFFVIGIFSIYWGSMYRRDTRLKNLRMLVVVDADVVPNGLPTFGDTLTELLQTPQAKYYGDWHVYNHTAYLAIAARHNRTIRNQIEVDVHHMKYWLSLYVHANATGDLWRALQTTDAAYTTRNHTVTSIYETGRDFINMNTYVTPLVQAIELLWLQQLHNVTARLVDALSGDAKLRLFDSTAALNLVSTPLNFEYDDRIPYTDPVLVAPSQVGLIYMIILTFFNVNFFLEVHQRVKSNGIKPHHFLLYRVISLATSYFWLSLMYSLVTLAMQVDFTVAFGRAGFVVYWMTLWVTMWIVGLVNEIMAMWFILLYPPLMGFWLLFWVIVNILPTFTPLALSPKVYRYGYALPLHNSYEITKVIFFDTWKGQLGRNYGILAAWVVITVAMFCATCVVFGQQMAKRAQRAKAH